MVIDKAEFHWEDTEKLYRETHNITGELTNEQENEIWHLAGNHIGLFLRWVIEMGLEGEEADEESCRKVRSGELSGTDYLLDCCDGSFWSGDVKAELLPFVMEYYEREGAEYIGDYIEICAYDDARPLYGVLSSEDDYIGLKKKIDERYTAFQKAAEKKQPLFTRLKNKLTGGHS